MLLQKVILFSPYVAEWWGVVAGVCDSAIVSLPVPQCSPGKLFAVQNGIKPRVQDSPLPQDDSLRWK